MTDKHTQGPWAQIDGIVVVTPETHGYGTWIANCAVGGNTQEEKLANAKLISAAPDLLTALRAVLSVADRKTDEFDLARAAIAKATGVQP